ncbi:hypothetical protein SAMN06265222_102219 [Neorhodopirellula lusitana]|uniref:Uncharacterized protein n=1 Tax=Neorhodopirellula lusitana TaxID=445327 RepID=A0ABY1PU31_9BACT|nr:hypothetical protein SAMN06265222_102219 [Neorhodopirellula lusitana]
MLRSDLLSMVLTCWLLDRINMTDMILAFLLIM